MKRYSKKKKRYTDIAVYQINIGIPVTYYASKHDLYSRLHYPKKQIEKYQSEIKKHLQFEFGNRCDVKFDGFELPF